MLKHELGLHWEALEALVWLPPWISPRRGFSHDASLNAKAHSNVTEHLLANCLDKRDCRAVLAEGLYPWLAPLRLRVAMTALMWSSVVEDLGDRLIPEGGKGLFGKETYCRQCEGRGYTRKNESVWQACPHRLVTVYEPRGSKDCDIYDGISEDEVGSAPIPPQLVAPEQGSLSRSWRVYSRGLRQPLARACAFGLCDFETA